MFQYIFAIILASLAVCSLGAVCKNPKIDTILYTTVDGMVISDVAFITEFSISCDSSEKDYILFADKKGRQIPALRSAENFKYQISWTENTDSLFSGEHGVNMYDEEGYAALKKAQRNNQDTSGVPSAFFLSLYHRGTYYGPWVSTEFIATATSICLWYIAFSARSNLMSS